MFTHIKQDEINHGSDIHISYLHRYVSAYANNKETIKELVEDIELALIKSKKETKTIIVDQDGECCFHVHPNGCIVLMLPWKQFTVSRDTS